jgi:hypothetical protein
MPVILATWEIRRVAGFKAALANSLRPFVTNAQHKKGLAEWFQL